MSKKDNERVERALRGKSFGSSWIRVQCPFCIDDGHRDRKTSLGVQSRTGRWHCFRCGESGRLRNPPDPNAEYDEPEEQEEKELKAFDPPDSFTELSSEDGRALCLKPARDYLRARGVAPRLWRELRIGACGDGMWFGRVIVPFISGDEETWWGWVGRLWVKKPHENAQGLAGLTYLYPKGMPRGIYTYNHEALRIETDEPVMIVEGVFDVMPFWPNAVATLGKPSSEQIEAFKAARRPVVFVPDGDEWKPGHALSLQLQFMGKEAGCVKLPPRVDPDEVERKGLLKAVRKSIGRYDPVEVFK